MTETFYNSLAPYYKYIYPNWDTSVQRQAEALDGVIRDFIGEKPKTVLDVACGIGTQSIGLAKIGYRVTSSDLSSAEIEQAQRETLKYGVQIDFQVVDMRRVWEAYQRQFDVVIACDNSVPHLLGDSEILLAFKQFYQCTKSGGCCIITVRDYAQLERKDKQKQIYPRTVHQTDGGQIVMFDVWNFDDDYYEMTTYIVDDVGKSEAKTQILRGGKYYCVGISTLEKLFQEAGFREVNTLRERFFQPLLIALK
jgi:cyclopropane fatty-acyl-phospholipid synthase-like methyltransferase